MPPAAPRSASRASRGNGSRSAPTRPLPCSTPAPPASKDSARAPVSAVGTTGVTPGERATRATVTAIPTYTVTRQAVATPASRRVWTIAARPAHTPLRAIRNPRSSVRPSGIRVSVPASRRRSVPFARSQPCAPVTIAPRGLPAARPLMAQVSRTAAIERPSPKAADQRAAPMPAASGVWTVSEGAVGPRRPGRGPCSSHGTAGGRTPGEAGRT